VFKIPKRCFTCLFKNLGHAFAGASFNFLIRIHQFKVKLLGEHAADGGFAGAHEADQGDV